MNRTDQLNKAEQAKFKEMVDRIITYVGDGPKAFASTHSIYYRLEKLYKADGLEMPGRLTGYSHNQNYKNLICELERLGLLVNKRKLSGSDLPAHNCTVAGYVLGPNLKEVMQKHLVRGNGLDRLPLRHLVRVVRDLLGKDFDIVYNVNVETDGTTPGFSHSLKAQGIGTIQHGGACLPGWKGVKAKPKAKPDPEPVFEDESDGQSGHGLFRKITDEPRRLIVLRILDVLRSGSWAHHWTYTEVYDKLELLEKLNPAGVKIKPHRVKFELLGLADIGLVLQYESDRKSAKEPRHYFRLTDGGSCCKSFQRW